MFELTSAGGGVWNKTQLYNFDGSKGSGPVASLLADAAGNLYGTTVNGGVFGAGTVFEVTAEAGGGWAERILHNFASTSTGGKRPFGGVIFDGKGNLWGTTADGGRFGGGEVFELTPTAHGEWADTVPYSFGQGTEGAQPLGSLVSDAAGHLYGTTSAGGAHGDGTIFEVIP